jgi:hypothetical protein
MLAGEQFQQVACYPETRVGNDAAERNRCPQTQEHELRKHHGSTDRRHRREAQELLRV